MPSYQGSYLGKRPVLSGFYPDPSVVRVGEEFFLANSSFEYAPGVPIHRSTDLRDWKFVGHALPSSHHVDLLDAGDSMGIFAPTIRYHEGKFFMITTCTDNKWQLLVTAEKAQGPWSDPVRIDIPGIDPDIAWDAEGNCLMAFASVELGGIGLAVIETATGSVIRKPELLWQGTGGKFPEGPHLYKIGDFWYLLIAEGGTERGHAVTIARARNFLGPYESSPLNPLLTNRGTNNPLQNTGHADLVQITDKDWAMVFHATRPRGSSPEWHVLGRETCAVKINWIDGWPKLGAPIEPNRELKAEHITIGDDLPPDWIAPASWPSTLAKSTAAGIEFAGFVGRRQLERGFDLKARLAPIGGSGIELRIDSRHWLRICNYQEETSVTWGIGGREIEIGRIEIAGERTLRLRAELRKGGFHAPVGPDHLIASVIDSHGAEKIIAELDGRYISTEVAGGMTGRLLGLSATSHGILKMWDLTWSEV